MELNAVGQSLAKSLQYAADLIDLQRYGAADGQVFVTHPRELAGCLRHALGGPSLNDTHRREAATNARTGLEEFSGILKRNFVATPHIFGYVVQSAGHADDIEIENQMIG